MSKRPQFIFLVCCLFWAKNVCSQEISRLEADSIRTALTRSGPGIKRLELLIGLAQFHINKHGENQSDLDSAEMNLKQAEALNANLRSTDASGYILLTRSSLSREKGQKDDGIKMAEKALATLKTGTNEDYLGQAYYELAEYYDSYDSLQALKKTELVEQAVNAFQRARNLKRKGNSLEILGDIYFIWGEEDKSAGALKDALAAYNTINYQPLQGIYVRMGRALYYKHDRAPALSYFLKALKIAQSLGDSSRILGGINNYLGLFYSEIDRIDMAVKYFDDAMEIARMHNDDERIYSAVVNLSYGYNINGQAAQSLKVLEFIPKQFLSSDLVDFKLAISVAYFRAYMGLMQLDKAQPYCDIVVSLTENKLKDYDYNMKALVYMSVARFHFLSGRYEKARYYLEKGSVIANKANYEFVQLHNLELSYKLDSVDGNFRSAFNYMLKYKQKSDSVSGQKKQSQFQAMNVEYELEMKQDSIRSKDKDISFLRQQADFQKANLKQTSLIKNLSIAGAILLMIILGLIYNRNRQNQKTNRLLQSQKEEINKNNQELQVLNGEQKKLLIEKDWLVKEIHHRVKNNLQMVVSLLNAQTEFLNHPSAIDAIKESRERMQAIAIIHQNLYQLDNNTNINMRSYINELIDNIQHSFADSKRIYFKTDVADISLDISQSVPLGLILNEAITNAIKYAYPKSEQGSIQISLNHHGTDQLQLKIEDNGKGLPADLDIKHSNSLGMQLISLFSEQLEGDLYFVNNNGLEIILNFKSPQERNFENWKVTA